MKTRLVVAMLVLALSGQALAEDHPAECRLGLPEVEHDFPLPHVAQAIAAKHLDVLVVGAGSSRLPGASGVQKAYPARLQAALTAKLPGIAVKVTADVQARRSAAEMVKTLPAALTAAKPELMVWQTGTVDAMDSVDIDQFRAALEHGISVAHSAGADVVFINAQYSPRTESMIALGLYADNMRWVALQQQVPVFDRFAIMKLWADLGTFDFYAATKKLDMAERVHDCIGQLLADLVIESAKPDAPHAENGR